MSEYDGVIRVTGRGSVETKFAGVRYRAEVHTMADTGPAAKEKAQPAIDSIQRVLRARASEAQIDMQRLRTSFDVVLLTKYEGNNVVFGGYKAVYKIAFEGTAVGEATKVHDALTSLTGVQAPTPEFRLVTEGVHERAFELAVRDARTKFVSQCRALELDPDRYEVRSWSVASDDEPRGKTLGASNNSEGRIVLEPGKAMLDLAVTVYFAKAARAPFGSNHT